MQQSPYTLERYLSSLLDGGAKHQTTDAAKTVDTDLRHLDLRIEEKRKRAREKYTKLVSQGTMPFVLGGLFQIRLGIVWCDERQKSDLYNLKIVSVTFTGYDLYSIESTRTSLRDLEATSGYVTRAKRRPTSPALLILAYDENMSDIASSYSHSLNSAFIMLLPSE